MRRFLTTLLLGLAMCQLTIPAGRAAASGSQKDLGDVLLQFSGATHFIWTDSLWYQPGENHTLRWTFAANNEPYPVTVFVYRENIRTGDRQYIANGSVSGSVTDAFGNGPGSYAPMVPADATAVTLLNGSAPSATGNYQYVAELRDVTGTQVIKRAFAKFNVVNNVVTLGEGGADTDISEDTTWTADTVYRLRYQVWVNDGATLTIEPGTLILASGQNTIMVVERGAKMMAAGTKDLPIVMTCDQPLGDRFAGCWGGLVVLGNATENTGASPVAEGLVPATRPVYGGSDDADSSGVFKYMRVEFAGVDFTDEIQPNAFGFHGVGSGTEICYIQAHEGEDDGIEFFGGTASMHHFVSDGSNDDSVDSTFGWRGYAQYGYVLQDTVGGDQGYEGDNNENGQQNTPRNNPQFYNMTIVGQQNTDIGILSREGHNGAFSNVLITGFGESAYENLDNSTINFEGVIAWGNLRPDSNPGGGTTLGSQVASDATPESLADLTASSLNIAAAPALRDGVTFKPNPDPRPTEAAAPLMIQNAVTAPSMPGGPYCGAKVENAHFIGAFDQFDNWTEGWTFFGPESMYDADPANDGQ